MKITSTRLDTGYYEIASENHSVSVWRVQDSPEGVQWWVVQAEWNPRLYEGPLPTKAAAVHAARVMILAQPTGA